jgi:hypothetical protein
VEQTWARNGLHEVARNWHNPRSGRVRRQGLEPRTRGLRVRCSVRLTDATSCDFMMQPGEIRQRQPDFVPGHASPCRVRTRQPSKHGANMAHPNPRQRQLRSVMTAGSTPAKAGRPATRPRRHFRRAHDRRAPAGCAGQRTAAGRSHRVAVTSDAPGMYLASAPRVPGPLLAQAIRCEPCGPEPPVGETGRHALH